MNSDNTQQNNNSEEIDLGVLIQKIRDFFKWIVKGIYNIFLFYRKFAVILIILMAIGFVTGYFMDNSGSKTYRNEVIVVPNFGSVDYLYTSIQEIEAKRKIGDISFFKAMGIDSVSYFSGIEIEPVIDIYSFLGKSPANLEAFKALKGDASSINDITTAKNYKFHRIIIHTKDRKKSAKVVSGLLGFLNSNDYYGELKNVLQQNTAARIKSNKEAIRYINDILRLQGNDSLKRVIPADRSFYFAESQPGELGQLVNSQRQLFNEIEGLTVEMADADKVIKDVTVKINIPIKGITATKKWLFPLLLFAAFSGVFLLIFLFKKMKQIATEE